MDAKVTEKHKDLARRILAALYGFHTNDVFLKMALAIANNEREVRLEIVKQAAEIVNKERFAADENTEVRSIQRLHRAYFAILELEKP